MSEGGPVGGLCIEDGLEWYRIENYDLLQPFLVNVVSPQDLWLFVSTSGALTGGRRSADNALFPYETEDRLHRNGGRTGPFTLLRVDGTEHAWEPFAMHTPTGMVHRSIAKTSEGDRLRFTEHHPALGLTFRYTWSCTADFGLVRTCELTLDEFRRATEIELLDGFVDVLPAGVELPAQQSSSSLVDAFRRSEFDPASGLALFTLEALVSDQSEPAESLSASAVWSAGLRDATTTLSDCQIRRFRSGGTIEPEHIVTGRKGAFLVSSRARLESGSPLCWTLVADVGQDHAAVARLRRRLCASPSLQAEVRAAQDAAHASLVGRVAAADALQQTGDRRVAVHHFANVLYNCLRGGVPVNGHRVELRDVRRFVAQRNRPASARLDRLIAGLEPAVERDALGDAVAADVDLSRLVSEYLPLTFSRRHGDPSRPWNSFHIGIGGEYPETAPAYEGNWRDIFQNWEALVHSFPGYAEPVVAKFLNASTLDGHNPFWITSDGIEWEMPAEGSWSNFGYWGDHQIVYLHRLLDLLDRFRPGLLGESLHRVAFSYANVPYRILGYDSIVADPKNTLEFDHAAQAEVERRVADIGTDGKLVLTGDGRVHHASLAEKLLVPALAKLSNLAAGGGIWLNTQRPEWNDANNALVGSGVSVVTALHLREYLAFIDGILQGSPVDQVPVAGPVLDWLRDIEAALTAYAGLPGTGKVTAEERRGLLDRLGAAFSEYRSRVYGRTPAPAEAASVAELRSFLATVRPHLDLIAATARRADGLLDAYRLLRLRTGGAELEPLYAMLEGQVVALGSTDTELGTAIELVDRMFASDLYRPDQESLLLYPNEPPPPFVQKNRVPEARIGPAMAGLIDSGGGIVCRDEDGIVRFAGSLRNARDLAAALDGLDPPFRLDDAGRSEVMCAYEAVFNHRAFTGRSQTMYRYEGLGSIYWHMVAKLLLALQERLLVAVDSGEDPALIDEMIQRYRRVRAGLGDRKTVAAHGAFPLDPHSHTPADSGARQPGMTGAAKDGVLLRWGELGVRVHAGRVRFRPILLDEGEFLTEPRPWEPLEPGQVLDAGTMGFTYCGVPVVYHRHDGRASTRVTLAGGAVMASGDRLDPDTSRMLFARRGEIARIDVWLRPCHASATTPETA